MIVFCLHIYVKDYLVSVTFYCIMHVENIVWFKIHCLIHLNVNKFMSKIIAIVIKFNRRNNDNIPFIFIALENIIKWNKTFLTVMSSELQALAWKRCNMPSHNFLHICIYNFQVSILRLKIITELFRIKEIIS